MSTTVEYALMAGDSYGSTRPDLNKFPVPIGWIEQIDKRQISSSGFEATHFTSQNSNEIVISYAGTDPSSVNDLLADGGLAIGLVRTSANLRGQVLQYDIFPIFQPHFHVVSPEFNS